MAIALIGLGVAFAAAIFLLTLIGSGVMLGPAALQWTVLLAFAPVPFYIMLVLWLDRVEREPLWLLALAFIYGGTFATCFGGTFNAVVMRTAGEAAATVGSAPIFEELFKGLFILAVFLWRRHEFDGVLDGVIYASMVGLGFAAIENIEYYGRAIRPAERMLEAAAGGEEYPGIVAIFLMRGVFSPYLHPMLTSMTGIGFGIAAHARSPGAKVFWPIAGYLVAVLLHAAWNGTAMLGSFPTFLMAYAALFVPLFVGLIVLAKLSMRREERIVREHLMDDVMSGWVRQADYEMVQSLRTRAHDLAAARTAGGSALQRLRKRLHQALTELAFYRCRVARGLCTRDVQTESDLLEVIREIERRSAEMGRA